MHDETESWRDQRTERSQVKQMILFFATEIWNMRMFVCVVYSSLLPFLLFSFTFMRFAFSVRCWYWCRCKITCEL